MREIPPLATSRAYVERHSRGGFLYYNVASMVALAERGVDAFPLDPALENLQPNIEKAIIASDAAAAGESAAVLDPRVLERIAGDFLGRAITIEDKAFRAALDPAAIVASRGDSGSAPDAVSAMAGALTGTFQNVQTFVEAEQARLSTVWRRLEDIARAI